MKPPPKKKTGGRGAVLYSIAIEMHINKQHNNTEDEEALGT
jgi:hypothetical protein